MRRLGAPGRKAFAKAFAVSALALVAGSGLAEAQKIAIIGMQQALLATSDGKKAAAAIDAKFAPVKAQLEQLAKDIKDKQDQFTKGRATMNASATAAAQAQIEALSTALKRKQEDAQQDLQEEENKQLGGIMPKLQQIINAYAVLNQITFVVDTSASPNNLVYADGSLNITAAVVTAYEKAAAVPAAAAAPPKAATPATTTPKTPLAPAPKTTAPPK